MHHISSLFQLIKSLKKSEKRYFKLYAQQQGKGSSNYVQLFDAIAKQETYNENALIHQFQNKNFINHFSVAKRYLFNTILKSLRIQYSEQHQAMQLLDMIKDISLLRSRGLIKEAIKLYEKTKELLLQNELYTLLIELLNTGEVLWATYLPNKKIDAKVSEIHKEKQKYIRYLKAIIDYRALAKDVKSILRDLHPIRNQEQAQQIHFFLQNPILQHLEEDLPLIAKITFYECLVICHTALLEYDKVYKYSLSAMQSISHEKKLTNIGYKLYLTNLHNFLLSCSHLGAIDDFNHQLKNFQALRAEFDETMPELLKIFTYKKYYNVMVYFYTYQDDTKPMLALEPDILKFMEDFKAYIDVDWKMTIAFNFAIVFFNLGNYDKALVWNNLILDEEKSNPKIPCICHARILNIMIHYELKNFLLLDSLFYSTYRFLNKKERLYKTERVLLNHFRWLSANYNSNKLAKSFAKLKTQLLHLSENKYERNFLFGLDIINWLDSKINHRNGEKKVAKLNGSHH